MHAWWTTCGHWNGERCSVGPVDPVSGAPVRTRLVVDEMGGVRFWLMPPTRSIAPAASTGSDAAGQPRPPQASRRPGCVLARDMSLQSAWHVHLSSTFLTGPFRPACCQVSGGCEPRRGGLHRP